MQVPYFIAEAGVNHNGDLDIAKNLVDVAATSGADAVKFQTFSADRLVTEDAAKAEYQTDTTGEGSQYEMLKRYELDRVAHEELIDYCTEQDITFLSTPFDEESAELLVDLDVAAIKVGSGELDNIPFLQHLAQFDRPLIVSTGMGTLQEVRTASETIREVDPNTELAFLHCTSTYPCPMADVNLRAMETMIEEFDVPIGYSDHTTRPETPAFAVAAGAHIVEKHFTTDSTLPGPDHQASLEPDELKIAVELAREASRARGSPVKEPTDAERETMGTIRKGLHASSDLPKGTRIEASHIDIIRPANGLSPRHYRSVLGAKLTSDLSRGDPIRSDDVDVELTTKREQ